MIFHVCYGPPPIWCTMRYCQSRSVLAVFLYVYTLLFELFDLDFGMRVGLDLVQAEIIVNFIDQKSRSNNNKYCLDVTFPM